jgi:hypothetical protein
MAAAEAWGPDPGFMDRQGPQSGVRSFCQTKGIRLVAMGRKSLFSFRA